MQPSEFIHDQADGLRELKAPKPVRVIAVTGGKGGVGKTSVSVNLAVTMAMNQHAVMLLDGDLGLANVDVMLGLQPEHNLADVVAGRCSLAQTLITGPAGLRIVPASSGKRNMAELTKLEHAGLLRAFSELQEPLDTLIVDTAAGIADSVITFTQASQEVIVVICNDPSSLTDAYALIKVLHRDHGLTRVHVISNMVGTAKEGREIYDKLRVVAERFLDVNLVYMGCVPHDEWLKRAVRRQHAVVEIYPNCPASEAFRALVRKIEHWGPPRGARGNLEFFVERLVSADAAITGAAA